MSDEKPRFSEPIVPKIQTCPRCGTPILIGDEVCSKCGYRVATLRDDFRSQPPNVVAFAAFGLSMLFALLGFGMEGLAQAGAWLIAFLCIAAGGLYYAAHLFLTGDERRKKPGQK